MYVAKQTVAASELEGGAVLLDLDQSRYFGLNPVGEAVWQELSSPKTPAQLCEAIHRLFEVSSEVCARDVQALLGELLDRGLIERHDSPEG